MRIKQAEVSKSDWSIRNRISNDFDKRGISQPKNQ